MAAGHEALLVTESCHLLTRLSQAAPVSSENLMQAIVRAYRESQPMPSDLLVCADVRGHADLANMSWSDLCDVVESKLAHVSLPWITARQSVSTGDSRVCGLVLGATTRRGARVTVATEQLCWQELLPYIHELARRRPADQQHP
eukprot:2791222-Amphidinium_carterae.3